MECNRAVVAIVLLLIAMAASIAVAILFPYVNLNAQDAAALLDMDNGGSGEGNSSWDDSGAFAIGPPALTDGTPANETHLISAHITDSANNESTAGDLLTVPNNEANNNNEDSIPAPTPMQHNNPFGGEENSQEEERLHPACQSLLRQADLNTNGVLTESQYAALVAELLQEVAPNIEAPQHYSDLPFPLKMHFVHLSCGCLDCCAEENGIYIGGSEQQHGMENALEAICEQTEAAINDWVGQVGA